MRIHITEILLFFSFTVEKSKKLLNTEKACWEIRITRVLNQGHKGRNLLLLNNLSPFLPFNTPFNTHTPEYCWQMQLMKKKFLSSNSSISNIPWAYHVFYEWPNPQQITCLSPDVLKMSYDLFACLSQKMIEVKKTFADARVPSLNAFIKWESLQFLGLEGGRNWVQGWGWGHHLAVSLSCQLTLFTILD